MDFLFGNVNNFFRMIAVTVLFVILVTFVRNKSRFKLPPGPICLPFLGYFPYVLSDAPLDIMFKFKAKYGNIFGMNIGCHYCIFINDFKSMKEAYNNKLLLERPPNYVKISPNAWNFMEMDITNWGDHYQFVKLWLRSNVIAGNRLQEIIMDEISRTLPKIDLQVDNPRFNIRDTIETSLSNTAFQVICGHWFEDDHPMMKTFDKFQRLLLRFFNNNTAKVYFPWIGVLQAYFDPTTKEVLRSARQLEKFMRAEVDARVPVHNEASENDYIDLFLTEMKRRQRDDPNTTFNIDVLVANCLILLLAAADTVRNVLEFTIMAMANFPDVQKKVHQELDSVLGRDRPPQLSDKGALVYTEATICEVHRWRTLTPINLLRMASADTTIQGYDVPKGTVIIHNMEACDKDPLLWPEPDKFKPERFLSKDLQRIIMPEAFMPFSKGKRTCPGDKVANMTLFLYFATIMQKYNVHAPEGGLNFEVEQRINVRAAEPVVKITRRHQ